METTGEINQWKKTVTMIQSLCTAGVLYVCECVCISMTESSSFNCYMTRQCTL